MKHVFSLLHKRRASLEGHAFFGLLRSDALPLSERFLFAPVMLDFIMGFADANKWFLSYAAPKDALERGINEHTEEDRKHSRLFIDNWHKLGLDEQLRWAPGKTLWWLYQCEETAVVRQFGMEILKLAVRYPDVHVRFALMEAIEVCGAVFFAHTTAVAEALSQQTGVEYVYFGHHHLERETGHLHTNESLFFEQPITTEQRLIIEGVVQRIFDNFSLVLDQLERYYRRLLEGRAALETAIASKHAKMLCGLDPTRVGHAPSPKVTAPIAASQLPIVQVLTERKARLAKLPFFDWLANDDSVPAIEKLQRFVALWGIDIAGYKDFCDFVLTYPEPHSPEERAINRWASDLASHGVLYLQDWQALGLDKVLGWDTSSTIAFYFLGDATELHRKNLARVTRHAILLDRPILRHWLITAFEAGGEALFERTAPLAELAEKEHGLVLNYWANRHYLTQQERATTASELVGFAELEVSDEERVLAIRMIHDLFDGFEAQFNLSFRLACGETFLAVPRSLSPGAEEQRQAV